MKMMRTKSGKASYCTSRSSGMSDGVALLRVKGADAMGAVAVVEANDRLVT